MTEGAPGGEEPYARAVPRLIERLEDGDPVARLSAHGELVRRTGRDFGFRAWADDASRREAVADWRKWWEGQTAILGHAEAARRGAGDDRRDAALLRAAIGDGVEARSRMGAAVASRGSDR